MRRPPSPADRAPPRLSSLSPIGKRASTSPSASSRPRHPSMRGLFSSAVRRTSDVRRTCTTNTSPIPVLTHKRGKHVYPPPPSNYTKSRLARVAVLGLIVVFLLVGVVVGGGVWAESGKTQRGKTQSIAVDFADMIRDPSMQDGMMIALQDKPSDILTGTQFAVLSLQSGSGWFLAFVASLDGPYTDVEHVGAGKAGALFVGVQDATGDWRVAVAGTSYFSDLLALISTAELPADAKMYLDPLAPFSVQETEYKFPWPAGDWEYRGGWHSSALDIGTRGSDKRVLAAAGGVVTGICDTGTVSTNVTIRHDDGKTLQYFHIDQYLRQIKAARRLKKAHGCCRAW